MTARTPRRGRDLPPGDARPRSSAAAPQREHRLDRVAGPQVLPKLLREVREGGPLFPIPLQTLRCRPLLDTRSSRRRPAAAPSPRTRSEPPGSPPVAAWPRLQPLGELVQQVHRLVASTCGAGCRSRTCPPGRRRLRAGATARHFDEPVGGPGLQITPLAAGRRKSAGGDRC